MEVKSLLYQFLVGGVFFVVGIAVPWVAGDFSWKRRGDRHLLYSFLTAALFYLVFQSAWHLYAAGSG